MIRNVFFVHPILFTSYVHPILFTSYDYRFRKYNYNKQLSIRCNSLAHKWSSNSLQVISNYPLFCMLAASILFSVYIFYFKLAIQERHKTFQEGKATLRKVLPKIMIFVFLLTLCFAFHAIFVNAVRAIDVSNYSHEYYPVKQLPYRANSIYVPFSKRSKLLVMEQKLEAERLIQQFLPFLQDTNTHLQALKRINWIQLTGTEARNVPNQRVKILWELANVHIRNINSAVYTPFLTYERYLNYKLELVHLTRGLNSPLNVQIINIMNKIPLNQTPSLRSFNDAMATFAPVSNVLNKTYKGQEYLQLVCEVCNFYQNYVPGQIETISSACEILTQFEFLAKNFAQIARTSCRSTSREQIANRINKITITKAMLSDGSVSIPRLRRSSAEIANVIANSPLPSLVKYTLKKSIIELPIFAATGYIIGLILQNLKK